MFSRAAEEALAYHHRDNRPGKLAIVPTKPLATQHDLAMAYSPGVAEPVRAIAQAPDMAYKYTSKGNLVAVISNGTAVLGLGNQGALASKPVMEGKAVLFKRFADVDVFDIEINQTDPAEVVRTIAAIAPTFGGINLEDIKAPECFVIEQRLQEMLDIPVFHDDQHGTAVVTTAALINALALTGKQAQEVRVVVSGAGAAALSCAMLMQQIGVRQTHITMVDSRGVIYRGRSEGMNPYKMKFMVDTTARTLADALRGADVFYGLSAPDVLTAEMLATMAPRPIVLALANPDPEIPYAAARRARPDAIVATGRCDDPNQVNNMLCFPFIFRGALDVRARTINNEMKIAAARAIADLARLESPECVSAAYDGGQFRFGPEYILPKAMDPRLVLHVAPAVAQAAMDSGVARGRVMMSRYRYELQERLRPYYHDTHFCGDCLYCKSVGLQRDLTL